MIEIVVLFNYLNKIDFIKFKIIIHHEFKFIHFKKESN